jgi:hypothetical protein
MFGSIGFSFSDKNLFLKEEEVVYRTERKFEVLDMDGFLAISIDSVESGMNVYCKDGPAVEIRFQGMLGHRTVFRMNGIEFTETTKETYKAIEINVGLFHYRLDCKTLDMLCMIQDSQFLLQCLGVGYYLRERITDT